MTYRRSYAAVVVEKSGSLFALGLTNHDPLAFMLGHLHTHKKTTTIYNILIHIRNYQSVEED